MTIDYNEKLECQLLDFVQVHYGLEIFTPGLERTRPLYLPFIEQFKKEQAKITIIAGTNGKGQTAHTLAHFLAGAGSNVALWTSPHILSIRERFHFNGEDVSYEALGHEIQESHAYLKQVHPDLEVSFYEFLFLIFLRLSSKQKRKIDHLILEVGLGGRLDAVNHFDADCACITSISRDHQSILGNRFDNILMEKIAVSRKGKPLFTQFSLEYLNERTRNYCSSEGVLWRPLARIPGASVSYFLENQIMAKEIFKFLVPQKATPLGDELPFFKGRREEMTFNGNTLIFIGAHNIDGIRKMTKIFSRDAGEVLPARVLISFSKRPINEVEVMLKTLMDFFGKDSRLYITSFDHPKALEETHIHEVVSKINKFSKGLLNFVTDWKVDLTTARNQKILVCGSYYFIGEVQRFINSHS
ncbi:MAG: hypothetical protein ACXVLQ_16315 [Bacteriovorax sp.]